LFLTEEKALKRIAQDRARNDLKRARDRALDAFDRWPHNFDLAMEAIRACIDLADNHRAVTLLKKAIVKHSKHRRIIEDYVTDAFRSSFNPFLGSFLIEIMMKRRDIEGVKNLLHQCPESLIKDMIKRSSMRAEGESAKAPTSVENDLLLGLLYIEDKQGEKAAAPFGRAIVADPECAQSVGTILVDLEREMPDNADVKFQLARTSLLLGHADKAEVRIFQCLELPDPPLESIYEALELAEEVSANHKLLKGEILIRLGKTDQGVSFVLQYVSDSGGVGAEETSAGGTMGLFPKEEDDLALAQNRLETLPDEAFTNPDVAFLYSDIAGSRGHAKGVAKILLILIDSDRSHSSKILEWLESANEHAHSGESRKLQAELHLAAGNSEKAAEAARASIEAEKSLLPSILEMTKKAVEESSEPPLLSLLAELYARAGDGESAAEMLDELKERQAIANDDLLSLSGKIMKHAGVSVEGVLHSIEAGIDGESIIDAAPYVQALFNEQPHSIDELAETLQQRADKDVRYWPALADLLEFLSKEDRLPKQINFLKALAHLESGIVEKAVFEFDQLLMMDSDMRHDLIRIYEKAAEKYSDNSTLHLALYQLHLEDEQLPLASHYLCRVIEIDPEQVKDVLKRFEKLVEKDPANISIWEEMLKASLASNRISLAREILKRAIQTLPEDKAAALHVYGTKVSISDGNFDDALRCIAVALTGEGADLRSIEEQLEQILMTDTDNQEARFLLGDTYLRLGRDENAVAAFKDCLHISPTYCQKIEERIRESLPTSVKPWALSIVLGEIAWMEKRNREAFRHFAMAQKGPLESLTELGLTLMKLYEQAPKDIELLSLFARNMFLQGKYDDSVALLSELLSIDESAGRHAMDILFELLSAEPDHFQGNKLFADIASKSGQADKSLEPIIKIMSHEEIEPGELDEIVSGYLPFHETNSRFLIPYAELKVRKAECGESLSTYRRAFEIDESSWELVRDSLRKHSWPEELSGETSLLEIDCLLAGGLYQDVYSIIDDKSSAEGDYADELIQRIEKLIGASPKKEYFSLGAHLLLKAGKTIEAEELLQRGTEALDASESADLRIELVEILQDSGNHERAAHLLDELIASGDDSRAIYRTLEESFGKQAERHISNFIRRLEKESPPEDEVERIIQMCLDCGRYETALDLIERGALGADRRVLLLAETYLAMDRPLPAMAVAGSKTHSAVELTETEIRTLYMEGVANEQLGNFARAFNSFFKIIETGSDYLDSRERAARNYSRMIESSLDEKALTLEVVGSLGRLPEGEDE
jgi:predicted Zn-dependent protease